MHRILRRHRKKIGRKKLKWVVADFFPDYTHHQSAVFLQSCIQHIKKWHRDLVVHWFWVQRPLWTIFSYNFRQPLKQCLHSVAKTWFFDKFYSYFDKWAFSQNWSVFRRSWKKQFCSKICTIFGINFNFFKKVEAKTLWINERFFFNFLVTVFFVLFVSFCRIVQTDPKTWLLEHFVIWCPHWGDAKWLK